MDSQDKDTAIREYSLDNVAEPVSTNDSPSIPAKKREGKTSLGHRKYKRILNNKKDIKENKKGQ